MLKSREYQHGLTPVYFQNELRKSIWNTISPELYTYFWVLTLDSIFVPQERYNDEIEKLQKEIQKMEDSKKEDNSSITSKSTKNKLDKEIERLKNLIFKMKDENNLLNKKKENVENFLILHKEKILEGIPKKPSQKLSTHFMQVN